MMQINFWHLTTINKPGRRTTYYYGYAYPRAHLKKPGSPTTNEYRFRISFPNQKTTVPIVSIASSNRALKVRSASMKSHAIISSDSPNISWKLEQNLESQGERMRTTRVAILIDLVWKPDPHPIRKNECLVPCLNYCYPCFGCARGEVDLSGVAFVSCV